MKFKLFFIVLALLTLGTLLIYSLISHSYQLSLESKVHYYLGDYDKAYKMAKEAHNEDKYNRMAATVMTQSNLALEYVNYIRQAKEYKKRIKEISQKRFVEKADRIRIKFMCDIIIERYVKLTPTVVIDEALKDEALNVYKEFQKIHEQVTDAL